MDFGGSETRDESTRSGDAAQGGTGNGIRQTKLCVASLMLLPCGLYPLVRRAGAPFLVHQCIRTFLGKLPCSRELNSGHLVPFGH